MPPRGAWPGSALAALYTALEHPGDQEQIEDDRKEDHLHNLDELQSRTHPVNRPKRRYVGLLNRQHVSSRRRSNHTLPNLLVSRPDVNCRLHDYCGHDECHYRTDNNNHYMLIHAAGKSHAAIVPLAQMHAIRLVLDFA